MRSALLLGMLRIYADAFQANSYTRWQYRKGEVHRLKVGTLFFVVLSDF
jgi:hypothetical protein